MNPDEIVERYGSMFENIKLTPRTFDVCLYHSGCPDGIGGAFPFWRENNHRSPYHTKPFIPKAVKHNNPYPKDLIIGKNVVIVDFSYEEKVIVEICEHANMVIILDHHDTSLRALKDLELSVHNLGYVFDMNRSGAQIAWNWCYPELPIPWFINIIAERDLWRWSIPHSKDIGKALYHFGWYKWDRLEELYNSKESDAYYMDYFAKKGAVLIENETSDINYAIATSVLCYFEGYKVRLASCNPIIKSEVGNSIANKNDCDFAALWRYDVASDQWWISLRGNRKCSIYLNKLTEKYGGGGHKKACGFAIHGPKSEEWIDATEAQQKIFAYGTIRDYFSVLKERHR